MSSLRVLLSIAIVFSPIRALIPYDEIKVNIFDYEQRDFEQNVLASHSKLLDFFSRDDVLLAMVSGMGALRLVPYVQEFSLLVPVMCEMMIVDQSEWHKLFLETTHDEITHAVSESEIRWICATMQTVQSKVNLLDDDNSDDENRKTVTSLIHTDLNRIMNLFELKSTLFRKYPLMGAPLLLQLASLVAIFSPIAQKLTPLEAMNPQISCKMHDILLDYRTRVVMARFHKLRSMMWFLETLKKRDKASLINVLSLPYNEYGYNLTNPPSINCEIGCDDLYGLDSTDACVRDDFSEHVYSGLNFGTHTCLEDYAALLRHRIEKLFPVDLLSGLCINRKPQQSTGYGWLTIHLINAYYYGDEKNGISGIHVQPQCKPYIKLFINNEPVWRSSIIKNDKTLHDPDLTFDTAKILKNSTIVLQIWDAGCGLLSKKEFEFSTNGDVDSFLNQPFRENDRKFIGRFTKIEAIETMSFWLDEYN